MPKTSSEPVTFEEIRKVATNGAGRIAALAKKLNQGDSFPITVRQLLALFGAMRRGQNVVWEISSSLELNRLRTDPDFETAYIDGTIVIRKDDDIVGSDDSIDIEGAVYSVSDPIYRLRMLESANRRPVSVSPNATIAEAITLMLSHDFSQLPVMVSDRSVKGIFSWQSYATKVGLGLSVTEVRECLDRAIVLPDDTSLFLAIRDVSSNQCVLVQNSENSITGIVTSSDVGVLFGQLSEPFLLLSEIEHQLRVLISSRGKYSAKKLNDIFKPENGRVIENISDLNFGEYVRLMENPDHWRQLDLRIDRAKFVENLDSIRRIRNDVMHFSPDPLEKNDLELIRKFTAFLQKLTSLLLVGADPRAGGA